MKTKLNCWEYMKCNKESNCPAALDTSADGLNHGINGGRICWAISGTFCNGETQGVFADKIPTCVSCDFFNLIKKEENHGKFIMLKPGQEYDLGK